MTTHEHLHHHNSVDEPLAEVPTFPADDMPSTRKPSPSVTIRLSQNLLFTIALVVLAAVAIAQSVQLVSLQRAITAVQAAPASAPASNSASPAPSSDATAPGGSTIPNMVGGC